MKRAEEMRELFARWKDSGMSLMAFGKQEGVPYSQLSYWRRKLGDGIARREAARESAGVPELVPVTVVAETNRGARRETYEIWLSNGVSLDVGAGFDEGDLRRLLGVLRSC